MRLLHCVFLGLAYSCSVAAQSYTISTFAGGGLSVKIPGSSSLLRDVSGVAVDVAGNLFFTTESAVLRLDAVTGILSLVAGNGTPGFSGDNGPATSAQLSRPRRVAVDSTGDLYIADLGNHRIRKVSGGVITTVAGNGTWGFSGDNGPATSAQLHFPQGVAVDASGILYVADYGNRRIRKVSGGVITTVAGGGSSLADNGPATSAQLGYPSGVAVDAVGNPYFSEYDSDFDDVPYNFRIRKVSGGVITTMAGGGSSLGDNGPASSARITAVDVAVDSAGNLYIADWYENRIRKVSSGVITTVAGNGTAGFSGDLRR